MKKNVILKLFFLHLILILVITSCGGSDSNNSNSNENFPTTPQEISAAIENTNSIVSKGNEIIDDAIMSAYQSDDLVDPNEIADQIGGLDGVEFVEVTPSGTGIIVKQKDGTYTNLIIVSPNDDRLFKESSTKSLVNGNRSVLLFNDNVIMPNGEGKALILAPFHSDFNENLEQISNLLETAGYSISTFENEDANLAKFRGDYLNNYDIVYISTHGAANCKTVGESKSTILLTGEEYTAEKFSSLSQKEQKAIATGGHHGNPKSYFAISADWIKLTTSKNFTNTWFYADACESAMVDSGSSSLSEALLNLGVAGYNGYDASIHSSLANSITEKMMARFTSGLSFNESSLEVLNDLGLKAKAWTLRLFNSDDAAIRVELFDYNKKISASFYLKDPNKIVGVAKVIPDAGPVGTNVTYEVTIKEEFISEVSYIEFDIDNTGEHLTMSKIDTITWIRDGLRAPNAESYPRIDTFTFSAFKEDGSLIGQGSATFSILEEQTIKSSSTQWHQYYVQ